MTAQKSPPTMHCPRCRSLSFDLVETFEENEYRAVSNGVVSRTADRWPGTIVHTHCVCDACSHNWTPRKATLATLQRPYDQDKDEG